MIDILNRCYPESEFGGFSNVDGTVSFYNRINAILKTSFTVLDVGCGRGLVSEDDNEYRKNLAILKGKVKKVIGVDIVKSAEANICLDEFRLIDGRA